MRRADATGRGLAIDGAFNVRDLGGLETRDGAAVRRGLVYRSGDLGRLTPAGGALLRALGVATVVDLRRATEVERHGRFAFERHGIAYRHLTLLDSSAAEPEALPAEVPPDILDQLYRRLAGEGGPNVGRVLTWLGQPGALPAVVHCVAGKDRTGMVIAVLLALLDVPDEEIASDYALSGAGLASYRARADEHDPGIAAWLDTVPPPLLTAEPAAMVAFLGWLRERHGSVSAYACSIGVAAATVGGLRDRLLTAPGEPSAR
jgi:protein-tyrosine phosphatase